MRDKLKEFYSASVEYRESLEKNDSREYLDYLAACAEGLPAGARILECGCGLGNSSDLLSRRGFDVTGTDFSPLFIGEAKKRHAEGSRLRFVVEDAAALSFPAASFDAVCSALMLEHVSEVERVLGEMARVLKPGGRMVITLPSFLDPFQQLADFIRWERMARPRPWEAASRVGALARFFWFGWIKLAKAAGLDRRIHYLEPVLAGNAEECGVDYDATWLANFHDVLRLLQGLGLDTAVSFPAEAEGPVARLMRRLRLPEGLRLAYEHTRVSGFTVIALKRH